MLQVRIKTYSLFFIWLFCVCNIENSFAKKIAHVLDDEARGIPSAKPNIIPKFKAKEALNTGSRTTHLNKINNRSIRGISRKNNNQFRPSDETNFRKLQSARTQLDQVQNTLLEEIRKQKNGGKNKNGMNLALNRLAGDFEKQVLRIMWRFANSSGLRKDESYAIGAWGEELSGSYIENEKSLGPIGIAVREEIERSIKQNEFGG